jgi:uncharacterized protein YcaQ
MVALSWSQVSAWRLSQHQLLERADRRELLEVVTRIGGVQAQLMPAAELALCARVKDLSPADVQNALWRDRSLIKTWVMRGTLHLVSAAEFPLYVAARGAHPIPRPPSYYTYHGVTLEELDAIVESIPHVLSDEPMTREQLAGAVAERNHNPNLRQVLLSGWGALLKPSAFRGDICFGPNQGQNVTFVRPERWTGAWEPMDPQEALKEVARRYLHAYGPATPDDFTRWWGLRPGQAKKLFRSLGDEIEAVDVAGRQAWALVSSLEAMQALEAPGPARLLPQFDAYVLGVSRDCEHILSSAHKNRVYRPQGWISAVVLVDGRIEGTWEYETQGSRTAVRIDVFGPASARVKRGIEVEVNRLGEVLNSQVELAYA